MTNIPEELLELLAEADIGTLWKNFKILEPNRKILKEVEHGIKLKVPINVFIKGHYEEFPKANNKGGIVRIHGFGKCGLYDFYDEEDNRMVKMLTFIYQNYDQDVTKSRIEDE